MPRDPERQKRIVRLIERVWKKLPDLRLFQLLLNGFDQEDCYYVEDDLLEERLKAVYKEYL